MKADLNTSLDYLCLISRYCHPDEKPGLLYCKKCGRELDNVFVGVNGRIFQVKEDIDAEPVTTHDGRVVRHADGRPMGDVIYLWIVSEVTGCGIHYCECGNRRKLVAP